MKILFQEGKHRTIPQIGRNEPFRDAESFLIEFCNIGNVISSIRTGRNEEIAHQRYDPADEGGGDGRDEGDADESRELGWKRRRRGGGRGGQA